MSSSSRKPVVKVFVVTLAAFIAFIGLSGFEWRHSKVRASASGPSPSHTSAPGETNCTACHGDFPADSGTGGVTISGVPNLYRPGQVIPLTVTVSQSDAVVYGFQLTALDALGRRAGQLTFPSSTPPVLQTANGFVNAVERTYIMHTVNGITPTQFGTKSWTFNWTTPGRSVGKVSFYAAGNAANSDGGPGGDYIYTTARSALPRAAAADFDGDGKSDISLFRSETGVWYSVNSSNEGVDVVQFGQNGDKIVPGDYDGDGKTDRALWRPSNGVWYVQKSSGGYTIVQLGSNGDIPVPGDYDGDLKSDLAVYRPAAGVWYIYRSSDGTYDIRQFGVATDKTAQADFDADGKTDLAVWRPSTGVWYIWRSSDLGFHIFGFGLDGDRPVQHDFDGDGEADAAVFRPSTGVWYILNSTGGFSAIPFGTATDRPAAGDYDGDGKADIAVFRSGVWYVLRSSDGTFTVSGFGSPGDEPVAAGYVAE